MNLALVGLKGLRQKTQQTATKDSTNHHKRLNKWHNSQFEMEENEEIFKKSFTKDSTNSTKDSTNRQKTQKKAQKTQQRDTKDSTNSKKKTK